VRVVGLLCVGLLLLAGCATNPAPRPHVAARERPPDVVDPVPEATRAEPHVAERPDSGSAIATDPVPVEPRAWFLPVPSVGTSSVISRFGDARDGGGRSHEGIDIAAPRGTPVVAPVGGRIVVSGKRSLGGNVVILIDSTGRYEFVFSHLHARAVGRGQAVRAGEILGTVGTTGNAAGGPPHLHFEVHLASGPVDPYPLLVSAARTSRGQ